MSPRSLLPLAPRRTLAELAYERLREAIIRGRLKPDEFLSTGEIARNMGISSMPVRAALARLRTEGLVSVVPQRGVRISAVSVMELQELFIVRSRLEGLAAGLACQHLTQGDLRRLRQLLGQMRKHARTRDVKRWFGCNEQWHQTIFRASANEQLTRLLFELWRRGMSRRVGATSVVGHMERRHGEHRAILAAFEKRDAKRAERLWRDHILAGGVEAINYISQAQAAPEPRRERGRGVRFDDHHRVRAQRKGGVRLR